MATIEKKDERVGGNPGETRQIFAPAGPVKENFPRSYKGPYGPCNFSPDREETQHGTRHYMGGSGQGRVRVPAPVRAEGGGVFPGARRGVGGPYHRGTGPGRRGQRAHGDPLRPGAGLPGVPGVQRGPQPKGGPGPGERPGLPGGALPCGPGSGWGTSPSRRCAPTGRSWRRP